MPSAIETLTASAAFQQVKAAIPTLPTDNPHVLAMKMGMAGLERIAPPPSTFAQKQDLKRAEIIAWRDAAIELGAPTPKGVVKADPDSQRLLTGAAMAAMLDENLLVHWTMKDGTTVAHTSAELITAGLAMVAHVDQQFATSRTLLAAVDATTTETELAAIAWPA